MSVRSASKQAFAGIQCSGRSQFQAKKILAAVRLAGCPLTRREIAHRLKMETSTVSARVNELVKRNKLADAEKRICGISKKHVNTVEAT